MGQSPWILGSAPCCTTSFGADFAPDPHPGRRPTRHPWWPAPLGREPGGIDKGAADAWPGHPWGGAFHKGPGSLRNATEGDGKAMTATKPVEDWASDFDVLDPSYVTDRSGSGRSSGRAGSLIIAAAGRPGCRPATKTSRRSPTTSNTSVRGGSPSSRSKAPTARTSPARSATTGRRSSTDCRQFSADPPLHTWTRRLLLPWFSHRRVAEYLPFTQEICRRLLDKLDGAQADAAVDYAQQIPVRVIAHVLGVPLDMSDTFTEWVREVLEFADDEEKRRHGILSIIEYLVGAAEGAPGASRRRPTFGASSGLRSTVSRSRRASCSAWPCCS